VQDEKATFLSLQQAMSMVREMKPVSYKDYVMRRGDYPGLPANPNAYYGNDYPGWEIFSSGSTKPYPTVEEARASVLKLGIQSFREYKVRRTEDPRLPLHPKKFYGDKYLGVRAFYGNERKFFATLAEASFATVAMGIQTSREYADKFSQDSRLPRHPNKMYGAEWVGWPHFLKNTSRRKRAGKYENFSEFQDAVRSLGVVNQDDYSKKYKADPKLPGNPREFYGTDWSGWTAVCAISPHLNKCGTWQEAKLVAAKYYFQSRQDYIARCGEDERLPKYPASKYKDFPGWTEYLLPDYYNCLDDFKCAMRVLGVRSSGQFREIIGGYPKVPSKPINKFSKEWTSWEDVLGVPTYYTYEELCEIVQRHGCNTLKEYKALVRTLKDHRMPSAPYTVYAEWDNAHRFLNKIEPYTLDFVETNLSAWVPSIKQWLLGVKAGVHKETSLCRFLRHFIGPGDLGRTPHEFLMKSGVDVKPFKCLLDDQVSGQVGRKLLRHVNEYLNHVLREELTIEDEETSELVRVGNASNPFYYMEKKVDFKVEGRPGQTTKPALAYQYVEALRNWIVPVSATSFSDLPQLQDFDSDYFEVDASLIDYDDPDCIFKERDGKVYLWYPGYWMHTYTLASIPARGRQIAYNDSGEADDYLADIVDGRIAWVKNEAKLAEWKSPILQPKRKVKKKSKGFMQFTDGEWRMHFTSNKTGFNGEGYKVDWAPEALIYWMVKLRKWQEKYNPVDRPFPWTGCVRTNLNHAQLEVKGENCFLFRGFQEQEPPAYSARSTERLAAALYYSQPKDLVLATFREGGSPSTLGRYESAYTPHSMRVSLITAYVVEFGLPMEVVMKLAGHSSIVMSIYYVKIGGVALRRRMDEGEKLALQREAYAAQDMIEQGRADSLTHQLVASSEQALEMLRSGSGGSTLVRDYGLCPYAAARCEDGGPLVGATQVRLHTPGGYLGVQNCPRCRHFITGPMFLGGLISLWNEISLRMVFLSEQYLDFEAEVALLSKEEAELEIREYDEGGADLNFDEKPLKMIRIQKRKLKSEMESTAKKMDMFLCDLQALTKHTRDCRELISKNECVVQEDRDTILLVVQGQHEIVTDMESTSLFLQLHEVCVNATIYQSASADFAVPRRSQMLDKMALMNDLRPAMCHLTEKEQLLLGNQVIAFLFSRVKSWDMVDRLIDGKLRLMDLTGAERIDGMEIQKLLDSKPHLLGGLSRTKISESSRPKAAWHQPQLQFRS
jgi:hypothetical protein